MDSAATRQILLSGLFLFGFAVVGTAMVAITEQTTEQQIIDNEREVLLRNLYALLPPEELDNDIATDTKLLAANELLGTEEESIVYRARLNNQPVAAIFNSIAPNGYSGAIHLLVGVRVDGSLAAVRVIKHVETPGLGDGIEARKSDWILGFDGKSLENPGIEQGKVRRDGGDFDQLTGATITPRAVIAAVKNTLLYYQQNADRIFID